MVRPRERDGTGEGSTVRASRSWLQPGCLRACPTGSAPTGPGRHRRGADEGSPGSRQAHHHLQPRNDLSRRAGACLPAPALACPSPPQWALLAFHLGCGSSTGPWGGEGDLSGAGLPSAGLVGSGELGRVALMHGCVFQIYEVVRPLVSLLHLNCSGLQNFEALMALTNLAGISERLR